MSEYHWPFLDRIGAKNVHGAAAKCVESVVHTPLLIQLRDQRIIKVVKGDISIDGGLKIEPSRGFSIHISEWDQKKIIEEGNGLSNSQQITFAHELAHTFHYDLTTLTSYPECCDIDEDVENSIVHCLVEDFADDFAFLWLSHKTHRDQLYKFLRHHQGKLEDDDDLLPRKGKMRVLDVEVLWPPQDTLF